MSTVPASFQDSSLSEENLVTDARGKGPALPSTCSDTVDADVPFPSCSSTEQGIAVKGQDLPAIFSNDSSRANGHTTSVVGRSTRPLASEPQDAPSTSDLQPFYDAGTNFLAWAPSDTGYAPPMSLYSSFRNNNIGRSPGLQLFSVAGPYPSTPHHKGPRNAKFLGTALYAYNRLDIPIRPFAYPSTMTPPLGLPHTPALSSSLASSQPSDADGSQSEYAHNDDIASLAATVSLRAKNLERSGDSGIGIGINHPHKQLPLLRPSIVSSASSSAEDLPLVHARIVEIKPIKGVEVKEKAIRRVDGRSNLPFRTRTPSRMPGSWVDTPSASESSSPDLTASEYDHPVIRSITYATVDTDFATIQRERPSSDAGDSTSLGTCISSISLLPPLELQTSNEFIRPGPLAVSDRCAISLDDRVIDPDEINEPTQPSEFYDTVEQYENENEALFSPRFSAEGSEPEQGDSTVFSYDPEELADQLIEAAKDAAISTRDYTALTTEAINNNNFIPPLTTFQTPNELPLPASSSDSRGQGFYSNDESSFVIERGIEDGYENPVIHAHSTVDSNGSEHDEGDEIPCERHELEAIDGHTVNDYTQQENSSHFRLDPEDLSARLEVVYEQSARNSNYFDQEDVNHHPFSSGEFGGGLHETANCASVSPSEYGAVFTEDIDNVDKHHEFDKPEPAFHRLHPRAAPHYRSLRNPKDSVTSEAVEPLHTDREHHPSTTARHSSAPPNGRLSISIPYKIRTGDVSTPPLVRRLRENIRTPTIEDTIRDISTPQIEQLSSSSIYSTSPFDRASAPSPEEDNQHVQDKNDNNLKDVDESSKTCTPTPPSLVQSCLQVPSLAIAPNYPPPLPIPEPRESRRRSQSANPRTSTHGDRAWWAIQYAEPSQSSLETTKRHSVQRKPPSTTTPPPGFDVNFEPFEVSLNRPALPATRSSTPSRSPRFDEHFELDGPRIYGSQDAGSRSSEMSLTLAEASVYRSQSGHYPQPRRPSTHLSAGTGSGSGSALKRGVTLSDGEQEPETEDEHKIGQVEDGTQTSKNNEEGNQDSASIHPVPLKGPRRATMQDNDGIQRQSSQTAKRVISHIEFDQKYRGKAQKCAYPSCTQHKNEPHSHSKQGKREQKQSGPMTLQYRKSIGNGMAASGEKVSKAAKALRKVGDVFKGGDKKWKNKKGGSNNNSNIATLREDWAV